MPNSEKPAKRQPPKGGRKGGTTFPRLTLKQALGYSDKLVRKTHTAPQPQRTILAGVFGNAGPDGKVRASALKQYGLLEGDVKAYQATKLAKDIDGAPQEDRPPLLQRAFLSPKLFKQIFETFHGDTVSKARIRQSALSLKVHPDSVDECVTFFVDSAETAGLGTRDGESLTLAEASGAPVAEVPEPEPPAPAHEGGAEGGTEPATAPSPSATSDMHDEPPETAQRTKAGVTVNLTVDSSLDTGKLEGQLALLRKYGVI
jgi:hypothetical protein